eukprot:SAG31_NODE_36826_length_310_cov_0.483412_1_plen_59_part_00
MAGMHTHIAKAMEFPTVLQTESVLYSERYQALLQTEFAATNGTYGLFSIYLLCRHITE